MIVADDKKSLAALFQSSAQTVASPHPADIPGLLHAEPGTVYDQVLQHSSAVLQFHTGEICMSTGGEGDICTRNLKFLQKF